MTSSEHFELCMFSIGMGTILMLVFGWFFIVPFASWINARIDRYRAETNMKFMLGDIEDLEIAEMSKKKSGVSR